MNRTVSKMVTPRAEDSLNELLQARGDVPRYREAMTALGQELGKQLASQLSRISSVAVVFTVEDADYLARGLLESLSEVVDEANIHVVCLWNKREQLGGASVAPIIRRYIEPFDKVDAVVVLKSIISSSCVVRTNLMEILSKTEPEKIYVAAPVMFTGSTSLLEQEFPSGVASKFEYVYFAQDDERDLSTNMVNPGIGGNVYELLGFENQEVKNRYTPRLIGERQLRL